MISWTYFSSRYIFRLWRLGKLFRAFVFFGSKLRRDEEKNDDFLLFDAPLTAVKVKLNSFCNDESVSNRALTNRIMDIKESGPDLPVAYQGTYPWRCEQWLLRHTVNSIRDPGYQVDEITDSV